MSLTEKLAQRPVVTVAPDALVAEAVALLQRHHIGALPVVDKDRSLAGILSERDIVRALADPSWQDGLVKRPVSDLMTVAVITCQTGDSASSLMEQMTSHRIRHIPIMQANRLVGMVSIGDVVNRMIEKYQAESEQMRDYINS